MQNLVTRLGTRESLNFFALLFLAAVILCGQIQNEVIYSVDGIVYALIGKELALRPLLEWAVPTWNHQPFYEHPPLMPWLLALSFKALGISTLAALLVPVTLSLGTVAVTYGIGRVLGGPPFGLLAGAALTLTPQFVKDGRNPMLEPALMFFLMLTLLLHLRKHALLAGISLALAVLSKGPPALLAPAVMAVYSIIYERQDRGALIRLGKTLVLCLILLGAFDLWHFSVAQRSFWGAYLASQLRFTIVESRGNATNDWTYYLAILFRYWPWLPFVLASPIAFAKKRALRPVALVGGLVFLGTLLGFTLMSHKAAWYTGIYYGGASLLVACTLSLVLPAERIERGFKVAVLTLCLPLLFLSASFPGILLSFGRPFETFMEKASHDPAHLQVSGMAVADCIPLEPWKGPFFFTFYLDATRVECADPQARYQLIDYRRPPTGSSTRTLFALHPFALVTSSSNEGPTQQPNEPKARRSHFQCGGESRPAGPPARAPQTKVRPDQNAY